MKKHELDTCTNYVYEKIHFVATEMTLKVRSYEKLAWNWWIKAIAHANANAIAEASAHAKRWPNLNICNKNEILRIAKIVFSGVFLNDDRVQCDTLCGTVRQAVQRLQSMLITIELETIYHNDILKLKQNTVYNITEQSFNKITCSKRIHFYAYAPYLYVYLFFHWTTDAEQKIHEFSRGAGGAIINQLGSKDDFRLTCDPTSGLTSGLTSGTTCERQNT